MDGRSAGEERRGEAAEQLQELVALERARLVAGVRARMGPALERIHEPEDVLQDALVRALQADADLRRAAGASRDQLRSFVLGTARNRILDLARQARPRTRPRRGTALPPALLSLGEAEAFTSPASARSVVAQWILQEEVEDALSRLGSLAPEQRLCVVLRGLLQLPWSTVAFALRRSPPAARKLYARARRNLARLDPD